MNRAPAEPPETAVLIHGLWMHGLVLAPHQHWLKKAGFSVDRFSYPSWSRSLDENVARLAQFIARAPGRNLHLVCHSLGGLLAILMTGRHRDSRIQRLVLMGTPFADCHCGRYLADRKILAPLLGHTMSDWLARPKPAQLPEGLDIGVIAGTRRFGLGCVIPGLERPNDGVVAMAETHLPGAKDTIALPVSHSGMLFSPLCARQVAHFLKTGHFIHD